MSVFDLWPLWTLLAIAAVIALFYRWSYIADKARREQENEAREKEWRDKRNADAFARYSRRAALLRDNEAPVLLYQPLGYELACAGCRQHYMSRTLSVACPACGDNRKPTHATLVPADYVEPE